MLSSRESFLFDVLLVCVKHLKVQSPLFLLVLNL